MRMQKPAAELEIWGKAAAVAVRSYVCVSKLVDCVMNRIVPPPISGENTLLELLVENSASEYAGDCVACFLSN